MRLMLTAAALSPYQTRQCLWEQNTRLLVWLFCFTSLSNSEAVCSLACTCVGFPMWSRHINPFTRISAKLPCRQALHLKCTISYPFLVWMQHFSNIKPEGSTQRMASSTQCIVPRCCLFFVLASVFPFILIFLLIFSLYILRWTESCELSPWGGGEVHVQSCLYWGFVHCSMCFGRSINMLSDLPGQGWGSRRDKLRYFI